jgi:hypothetical protein
MTNILTIQPTEVFSILGTKIHHIYKCDGLILCDFYGISSILGCSWEKAVQIAVKHDRLTVFEKQLYCTADDLAFLIDELPEVPLTAKELAKKIHKTSTTELSNYFLFNQQ